LACCCYRAGLNSSSASLSCKLIEDPTVKKQEKTAEEELAESIRRLTEAANNKN
jgi:hypothetical protein